MAGHVHQYLVLVRQPIEIAHHLCVRVAAEGTGASAAGTVGARDAAKPLPVTLVALDDSVKRHELQVVGMCADTQMGNATQSFDSGLAIGDKNFRGCVVQ